MCFGIEEEQYIAPALLAAIFRGKQYHKFIPVSKTKALLAYNIYYDEYKCP